MLDNASLGSDPPLFLPTCYQKMVQLLLLNFIPKTGQRISWHFDQTIDMPAVIPRSGEVRIISDLIILLEIRIEVQFLTEILVRNGFRTEWNRVNADDPIHDSGHHVIRILINNWIQRNATLDDKDRERWLQQMTHKMARWPSGLR
ncbi:unnamed protein product [Onchocerca flexuosa]|uniref:Death domain-containing protein n=1 Tax=Onchocerca flexuosa TaxID=387005 RepID=A0A183GXQ4_9BILA|nr:unnamed protein product [Onchocerca flexuosa]